MPSRRPLPLALTDEQLQIILHRASLVPPAWRKRFLAHIADILVPLANDCGLGFDGIDDAQVHAAASEAVHRFGNGFAPDHAASHDDEAA
jgi:hypothetical protein